MPKPAGSPPSRRSLPSGQAIGPEAAPHRPRAVTVAVANQAQGSALQDASAASAPAGAPKLALIAAVVAAIALPGAYFLLKKPASPDDATVWPPRRPAPTTTPATLPCRRQSPVRGRRRPRHVRPWGPTPSPGPAPPAAWPPRRLILKTPCGQAAAPGKQRPGGRHAPVPASRQGKDRAPSRAGRHSKITPTAWAASLKISRAGRALVQPCPSVGAALPTWSRAARASWHRARPPSLPAPRRCWQSGTCSGPCRHRPPPAPRQRTVHKPQRQPPPAAAKPAPRTGPKRRRAVRRGASSSKGRGHGVPRRPPGEAAARGVSQAYKKLWEMARHWRAARPRPPAISVWHGRPGARRARAQEGPLARRAMSPSGRRSWPVPDRLDLTRHAARPGRPALSGAAHLHPGLAQPALPVGRPPAIAAARPPHLHRSFPLRHQALRGVPDFLDAGLGARGLHECRGEPRASPLRITQTKGGPVRRRGGHRSARAGPAPPTLADETRVARQKGQARSAEAPKVFTPDGQLV